ncbi:MAG: ABC transporter substrate-binding protein [Desulfopila sp.]|jgi:putative ABC transport system substrate-binding protein|nr:ABC transporter substrate-binding protein [Desulfopila sp.]
MKIRLITLLRASLLPAILLSSISLQFPNKAQADEGKMLRVCVTKIVSHAALDAAEKGFEAGLASAGFKEGVNVIYERRNANGDSESADAISQELAAQQCDLIHTIATPTTQSVLKYVNRTPVIFSAVTDPEAAGIVPRGSVAGSKTGTHVTGVSDKWPVNLQMRTYAKFVAHAKVWGTIYNPSEDNSISHVSEMRQAVKDLGLELIEVHAANAAEVEAAARSLVGRVQAIAITADNTSVAHFEKIAGVCNENQIALFAGDVDSVPKGAIAAYGTDYFLIGYSAGKKAALILRGIKPGDIAWGLMEKFSLVINRRAASLQGVTVDPDLLRKADKLID